MIKLYLRFRPAGLITGKEITTFVEFCPSITTVSEDLKINDQKLHRSYEWYFQCFSKTVLETNLFIARNGDRGCCFGFVLDEKQLV